MFKFLLQTLTCSYVVMQLWSQSWYFKGQTFHMWLRSCVSHGL